MHHHHHRRRGLGNLILTILATKGPMTGADIMREIEKITQGFWRPSPGAIYPALEKLESEGLIRVSNTEGPKTYYEITEKGKEVISPSHQYDVIIEEIISNIKYLLENKQSLTEQQKAKLKEYLTKGLEELDRS